MNNMEILPPQPVIPPTSIRLKGVYAIRYIFPTDTSVNPIDFEYELVQYSAGNINVATLFQLTTDTNGTNVFTRIATTVPLSNGAFAIGTTLERSNPAYAALSNGSTYYGNSNLFGALYESFYWPCLDPNTGENPFGYFGYCGIAL